MLGISTHKPDISSFQSIEFHLSENHINSQQNLSFRNINNGQSQSNQPASLTYTMSHQQIKQTINYDQSNKQNFQFQANLSKKTIVKVTPAKLANQPNMKKKKSILNIQNLELEVPQSLRKEVQKQPKCIMRLRKKTLSKEKSSYTTSRKRISSNASNASLFSQVSSLPRNPSRDCKIFSQNKIELSHLSTQDKSIIFEKQNSLDKIKESRYINQSCIATRKKKSYSQNYTNNRYNQCSSKMNLQTKRKSIIRQSDNQLLNNLKAQNISLKIKQKCFLQDKIHDKIESALKVQSIKLEQNKKQSKLYLRKIIQCRVSVQHYAQTSRIYN